MMNTVWEGLPETRNGNGHILFIEEDHYILPNAYRAIQQLRKMVSVKCPECVALTLAPQDVKSKGEQIQSLIVEKVGNIGYAFNRTVWNWIHAMAKGFCEFDDYNWDITMWSVVYPSFPTAGYALRGSKASAVHFGKCGLHQGQDSNKGICVDDSEGLPSASDQATPFLDENWPVVKLSIVGYNQGFAGWGGWGDKRDQELCLNFSRMYQRSSVTH
jgi:alpha-1,6-mannosyl-glycoprotein beta-1,2-N-acetylglucosaminyltransferase